MAHVAASKKKEVTELVKLMDQYPVLAVVNMANLPARQLQTMRGQLRGKVVLRMSKRRLIKLALTQSKKEGIGKLEGHLKGMPALLFSKESPFTLYKILKKSKSKAPIKAGQIAPNDIIVPAGPTSFSPGPVIGELGALKIKAGIEGGKVAIKQDATVAKEGDVVSSALASILTRLGIEPMEIGLELVAAYEQGEILKKDVLDVDEDAYLAMLAAAHHDAFALSLEIAYPTKETIMHLISQAFRDTKALAIEQGILSKETVEAILGRADAQAQAVQSHLQGQ